MTDKAHNMVTVTDGHIEYVAEYFVNDEMITVNAAHEHKTTQLGVVHQMNWRKCCLGN
jgi:hypothetical protein